MDNLSKRMSSDFTLFNLNDPETTKFYVSSLDFFVSNFPYFKDLKALSAYFLSKNRKFDTKFKTRITKFLDIIDYNPDSSPLPPPRPASLTSLKDLSLSSSPAKYPPLFPNHFPSGPEFTVNPFHLVMKFYSRILLAFTGQFIVSPQLLSKLISKASNQDVASLLCSLVRFPSVLEILLSTGGITRLCDFNLPVLAMITEACLLDVPDHSLEEKLLSAIYESRSLIINEFLSNHSKASYSILHILCSNKGSLSIQEISPPLDSFALYYYRILSFNTTFSNEVLTSMINLFFIHTNCSHLLLSICRILLKTEPEVLHGLGFFSRLKESTVRYSATYSLENSVDSLLAFLVKIYSRTRSFIVKLENQTEWTGMIELLDYFIRLERISYKEKDLELCDEVPVFRRYVIECFLSELPYSSVFDI